MEARTNLAGSPSEEVRAHMATHDLGPVVIVQAETMVNPSTERYAKVFVCFHGHVAVSWCGGDEHTFDALTGCCIESSDGRMKGWRLADWEMHRFNAVDAAKWLDAQRDGALDGKTTASDDVVDAGRMAQFVDKMIQPSTVLPTFHNETTQDVQPARSVLFIATCYPGGSFAVDAIDIVHNAMHAIALERGIITTRDQCEYVTMGGSLVGQRFDVVVSTDDWLMNILPRDGAETRWWNSQVTTRKRVGSSLHFLSTVLVKRRPVPAEPTASLTQP